MGRIVSIVRTSADEERQPADRYARTPMTQARLVKNRGIDGDVKAKRGRRQLNVMSAETIAELRREGFKTAPGELGEQIVVAGEAIDGLPVGTHLQLGTAVIEVTLPRTGCGRFEHIQGKSKQSAAGRLGVMAKVVTTGEIAVGDEVRVLTLES